MTLEEFQARPREDWDFSVLCDELELMILSQAGWREKAERLERGRDEAQARYEAERHECCEWEQAAWIREQECDRLRAALERYGDHLGCCDTVIGSSRPCTCGLDEALEEK